MLRYSHNPYFLENGKPVYQRFIKIIDPMIAPMISDLDQAHQTLAQLTQEYNTLCFLHEQKDRDYNRLHEQYAEAIRELTGMRNENERLKSDGKADVDTLKAWLIQQQARNNDLQKKLNEIDSEKNKLEDHINALNMQREIDKQGWYEKFSELKKQLEELDSVTQSKLTIQQNELIAKDNELNELKEKNQKMVQLKSKIADLEKEVSELKQAIELKRYEAQKNKKSGFQEQEALKGEILCLRAECEGKAQALESLTAKNKNLEAQLKKARESLKALEPLEPLAPIVSKTDRELVNALFRKNDLFQNAMANVDEIKRYLNVIKIRHDYFSCFIEYSLHFYRQNKEVIDRCEKNLTKLIVVTVNNTEHLQEKRNEVLLFRSIYLFFCTNLNALSDYAEKQRTPLEKLYMMAFLLCSSPQLILKYEKPAHEDTDIQQAYSLLINFMGNQTQLPKAPSNQAYAPLKKLFLPAAAELLEELVFLLQILFELSMHGYYKKYKICSELSQEILPQYFGALFGGASWHELVRCLQVLIQGVETLGAIIRQDAKTRYTSDSVKNTLSSLRKNLETVQAQPDDHNASNLFALPLRFTFFETNTTNTHDVNQMTQPAAQSAPGQ